MKIAHCPKNVLSCDKCLLFICPIREIERKRRKSYERKKEIRRGVRSRKAKK